MKAKKPSSSSAAFVVAPLSGHWSPGAYSVGSPRSRRQYTVIYHGTGNRYNSCQCMDFRTGGLGTCRHIEAVEQWISSNSLTPAPLPRRTVLDIDYTDGRSLRLRLGENAPKEVAMAAMRFFDDDFYAVEGMVAELPSFIELARRIDSSFHCCGDALNYVLDERDRLRRMALAASLSDDEIGGVLRTTLYPYQIEGIRFAFGAGRSLIADETGLGKTVQALGTAELLRSRNMAASVLVVCPTSLKYQWKKSIERFTEASVAIIEGSAPLRRAMYTSATAYKIVSYHTLANDIKAVGTLAADILIMDEAQRLMTWNSQIAQAPRRVESEYAVVISGTPLACGSEELRTAMQFVDQYALGSAADKPAEASARLRNCMLRRRREDVAEQLPERTEKTLYVPMTREQKEIHDEALETVAQLVSKWQRYRFLSEKDRKRLLLMTSRMRMVCDSTYVLDLRTRCDTKVAETVQLLKNMRANGGGKAVVFSQWERMTQLLARELEAEGMSDCAVLLTDSSAPRTMKVQGISMIINADMPWNPLARKQRLARVAGQDRIHVINLIAAGTIEEKMHSCGYDGLTDIAEDSITLDDDRLTRIADCLSRAIDMPDTPGAVGTVAENDEDERRAAVLPEQAEHIIGSMLHVDETSGRTELRIPLGDRRDAARLFRALAALLE